MTSRDESFGRVTAKVARGILSRGQPDGSLQHRRVLPVAELAHLVAHFWWVQWNLRGPFNVATLPHPTVHITFDSDEPGGQVGGPATRRFTRGLSGSGQVCGIKFRPAMFAELQSVQHSLVDQRLALAEVFPLQAVAWQSSVAAAVDFEAKASVCETALLRFDHSPSPIQQQVRDLVELTEQDRSIVSVSHLVAVSGLPVRALERAFLRYVGKSPKWVIRRYRLIEAAERLLSGSPPESLTALALELGYYDHAHFTRDFRTCTGSSPSELRRSVDVYSR